jgi:hypothetical protein
MSERCTCSPPMLDLDCPIHGQQVGELVAKAMDEGRVIAEQPPGRCELCGAVDETRPYGPNGEEVCFDCGMKDEAAVERGFDKRFDPPGDAS